MEPGARNPAATPPLGNTPLPRGSVARFRDLLRDEREAARRADTAALVSIQDRKREALAALRAEPEAFSAARASLAAEAERNVALLRQLHRLYEGALSLRPATYGRVGRTENPCGNAQLGDAMSVFNLLNVGRTAMNATAFGTQTHGQNAANAATEGYTRRVARLQPVAPPPPGGGGAQATGALRKIDPYVERRLLGARTEQGGAEARLEILGRLDTAFADEEGNVAEALAAFEGSLRELAAYPGDAGAREAVLGRAEALERAFRSAAGELARLRQDAGDRVSDEVRTVNERLGRIAELGNAIARSELSGREASDLRDQRDQALRELADQVPITVLPRDDGQVTVLLAGNLQLVDEDGNVSPLGTRVDADDAGTCA